MKELELRYYPDPVLRQRADPVESFDDELRELACAMVGTMLREKGIGLAAPQVGWSRRLIVVLQMKTSDDTEVDSLVLINPRVVATGGELWSYEEGCLSIPDIRSDVVRCESFDLTSLNLKGERTQIHADGLLARIILHEVDHLDGKLFIDYLSPVEKIMLKEKLKALEKESAILSR